jgi:hypothetical protein
MLHEIAGSHKNVTAGNNKAARLARGKETFVAFLSSSLAGA